MIRCIDSGPIWRRTLVAATAMILASLFFVGVALFATDVLVDVATGISPVSEAFTGVEPIQATQPLPLPPLLRSRDGDIAAAGDS
jgi:hypothetical protein